MKTSLDCTPCFVRQALGAARKTSPDPAVHERVVREALAAISRMDLNAPPPVMARDIHRRLREITGAPDPYRRDKDLQNRMALELLPELEARMEAAEDRLGLAVRLVIAGNVIDLGVQDNVTPSDLLHSLSAILDQPLFGDVEAFRRAVDKAQRILYLADNAGEIVLDRLLVQELPSQRVTLAVRGGPVINDATLEDARAAGLDRMVKVMGNGSDAPGTILEECSREFQEAYARADLIISKGQGNYETLSGAPENIFFLFKVKCAVIANHSGLPQGAHALLTVGGQRLG